MPKLVLCLTAVSFFSVRILASPCFARGRGWEVRAEVVARGGFVLFEAQVGLDHAHRTCSQGGVVAVCWHGGGHALDVVRDSSAFCMLP